jgi:hypothetical protein
MALDIFWIHFIVLFVVFTGAYFMHLKTLRLRARFNLYRVRDRFVLLVADDVLSEDSRLFLHYYGRINRMLHDKPSGIDDILHMVFHKFKDGDFSRILSQARKQAEKLAADPAAKHPDVRAAAADYYAAVEMLILSHSSILRASWILSKHIAGKAVAKAFAPFAPPHLQRGWAAVGYTEAEARAFAPA